MFFLIFVQKCILKHLKYHNNEFVTTSIENYDDWDCPHLKITE